MMIIIKISFSLFNLSAWNIVRCACVWRLLAALVVVMIIAAVLFHRWYLWSIGARCFCCLLRAQYYCCCHRISIKRWHVSLIYLLIPWLLHSHKIIVNKSNVKDARINISYAFCLLYDATSYNSQLNTPPDCWMLQWFFDFALKSRAIHFFQCVCVCVKREYAVFCSNLLSGLCLMWLSCFAYTYRSKRTFNWYDNRVNTLHCDDAIVVCLWLFFASILFERERERERASKKMR